MTRDDDVTKTIRSRKVADRLSALSRIRKMKMPERETWSAAVVQALEDSSNLAVQSAVRCLRESGWFGERTPIDELRAAYDRLSLDGLKRDPGCIARIEIVEALAEADSFECGDLFIHATETVQVERSGNGLEDMAVPLRAQAAAAIARVRPQGALTALTLLLFDMDPRVEMPNRDAMYATASVRKVAAQAIGAIGDPGGVAVLTLRLAHSNEELPDVVVECMDALVHLDNEAALRRLPAFLNSPNEYLVVGAATALARVEDVHHEKVVERLIEASHSAPLECRDAIGLALASMRSQHADAGLATMAHFPDETVRHAAVVGLAQRGSETAHALLRRLAELDPVDQVRNSARDALSAS